MVIKHMQEILEEALGEKNSVSTKTTNFEVAAELVHTEAIQNLIKYIDNLEAELIVRRTADLPNATVLTFGLAPKENSAENSLNS